MSLAMFIPSKVLLREASVAFSLFLSFFHDWCFDWSPTFAFSLLFGPSLPFNLLRADGFLLSLSVFFSFLCSRGVRGEEFLGVHIRFLYFLFAHEWNSCRR